MVRVNSFIFLGDLVRAFKYLQPADDATQRSIAQMLGLQWKESSIEALENPVTPSLTDAPPSSIPPVTPPLDLPQPINASDLVPSSLERSSSEAELRSFHVVALPQQVVSEEAANPPVLEPLLVPTWTRHILSTTLSTNSDDGPLDILRIVESLARGEHLWRLPKSPYPTLQHGAQVLVDKSYAMVPFARDQAWLETEIRRVVGVERAQILRFAGSPLRGAGPGSKKSWSTYRPPLPGTVILLLTDLGIGQPMLSTDSADIQEWLNFASLVHRAGSPLVAFVPYAPFRWPQKLVNVMTVIQWDRGTSAATVQSRVGRTHKVTR